ncbi:hypothetical protein AB5N19_04124 [Seiridium cardinale]|uniref:Uncharacterized protein n=1 Tax=Seiridium cardinale TaxID=138064 RepID=A0ABR2Y901_9PEZI
MTAQILGYESCKNCNGDFALQKYLLLQGQLEELTQHMHELCPAYSYSSSTTVTSPSLSPTRLSTLSPLSSKHTSPSRNHRRSSGGYRSGSRMSPGSLEPVLDEELVGEMRADEQKLCDVNEGIKRALTELLNSEAVRTDRTMRTWVQTRLMDTERELRTGRRRRSNGSTD